MTDLWYAYLLGFAHLRQVLDDSREVCAQMRDRAEMKRERLERREEKA